MKTRSTVFLICSVFIFFQDEALAQEIWPEKSSSISVFGSSLLLSSVINLSYEKVYFTGKNHFGFTTGLTNVFYHAEDFMYMPGVHGALTFLSGTGLKHFEVKAGVSVQIIWYDDDNGETLYDKMIIPVISLGCRRQLPDSKSFFRWAVSTAGFGIGFGYVFGK